MRRALAFLTPLFGASEPRPETLTWFPFAGAALGLVLGGVWWGAERVRPAAVAAAIVVAADLALTGLLHVDGLADSADGLLPQLDRTRRLEVMATPDVGAFGVATVGAVLLLRWASLATMAPSPLLLGGLWCASRTAMAVTARTVPYARPAGSRRRSSAAAPSRRRPRRRARRRHGVRRSWPAGRGRGRCGRRGSGRDRRPGAPPHRRVHGRVLGASGMVGETAGLVVAAARW